MTSSYSLSRPRNYYETGNGSRKSWWGMKNEESGDKVISTEGNGVNGEQRGDEGRRNRKRWVGITMDFCVWGELNLKLRREGIFWEDTAASSMLRHHCHHCRATAFVVEVVLLPLFSKSCRRRCCCRCCCYSRAAAPSPALPPILNSNQLAYLMEGTTAQGGQSDYPTGGSSLCALFRVGYSIRPTTGIIAATAAVLTTTTQRWC